RSRSTSGGSPRTDRSGSTTSSAASTTSGTARATTSSSTRTRSRPTSSASSATPAPSATSSTSREGARGPLLSGRQTRSTASHRQPPPFRHAPPLSSSAALLAVPRTNEPADAGRRAPDFVDDRHWY